MGKQKSKVRLWRRDAFRALQSCLEEQHFLPWFQSQGHRLKGYAETYYDALGQREWNDVSVDELKEAVDFFKENSETLDGPFLVYVGELLLSAKGVGEPRLFEGLNLTCVCGGTWSLSRTSGQVVDWVYNCSCCNLKSKVDISGLPMSLPAPQIVRSGRARLHSKLESIVARYTRLNVDDIYSLLSFYTGTPLGYVHLGYLQTVEAIEIFSSALAKIERDAELVAQGESCEAVLQGM